ncbi:MAG: phosphatase PAP2 family protein, partial [Muribaculaceae bacterium]|nr:phosphatase PAP2 family protein [Muribaculaceae bacterium]
MVMIMTSQPLFAADPFHRTTAQKGVKTSTDVILVALPAAALTGVLIEKDWQGLKQGALTAVTSVGATYILKYAVKERRPDGSDMHSFPSGHTSTTFATATFLQRRYGWKVGVPAYVLSSFVGGGRVFSKKHHWWDVAAGAAIGAGAALIYT